MPPRRWPSPSPGGTSSPTAPPNLSVLWDRLAEWETLGDEVVAEGYPVSDWIRACALQELVPSDLAAEMATRPELCEYRPALTWVRHRLTHQRALTQAAAASKNSNDMQVGSLEGGAAG